MPIESNSFNMTPEEMERTRLLWRDESYLRDLAAREPEAKIEESLATNDEVLKVSGELREERAKEAAKPKHTFNLPPDAQAFLDARRVDYDRRWETEAAKSIPRTQQQLHADLERAGIRREPPTAEEVEAQEQERLAQLRAEASARNANHASKTHKGRTSSSKVIWRPKGSIQRDIASNDPKVSNAYKEQDQLSL